MPFTVDTAYVEVMPDFSGFGARVKSQMDRASRSISSSLGGGLDRVNRSVDETGQRIGRTGSTVSQRLLHPLNRAGGATREVNRQFMGLNSHVGTLSRIGPRAFSIFATGAAAAGIGGLVVGVKGFMAEAREAQKVSASTTQGIKTIGAGSWTSVKAIEALSQATSDKIGVDDELIQQSANLLLTFKQIKNAAGANNDIFDRAVIASQDLSAKGFGSAEGSAKMLGKALNDPLKGITALGRAGVTFTQGQKDQIKSLVESGDMLTAQKIIMKEVEAQVGGTAEATATAGDKMKVVWGNFQEFLGKKLIPIFDKVANVVIEKIVPALQTFAGFVGTGFSALAAAFKEGDVTSDGFVGTMERIGVALRGVVDWVQGSLVPALQDLARNVGPVLLILFEDIGWVLQNVVLPVFAVLGAIVVNVIIPAISALAGWISKNQEIIPALGIAIGVVLIPAFVGWAIAAGAAAVATIAANAPIIALVAVIAGAAFLIIKHWDTIKGAFVGAFNWVKDNWPLLLAIITGPIGIATKLIIDNWDTVKQTFVTVFSVIGVGLGELAKVFIRFGKIAFDAIWNFVLSPLRAMLNVMSKLPLGMGKPFGAAKDALDGFKNSAQDAFDGAMGKVEDWQDTLRKAPKIAKLKGDITDLDTKIKDARKKLTDPKLTNPERSKLKADISQLMREKKKAQDAVDAMKGKTVNVKLAMSNKLEVTAKRLGFSYNVAGKPMYFQHGGLVRGPGGPTGDKIPAMLSDYEGVINARSMRKLGPRALALLNRVGDIGGDIGGMIISTKGPLKFAAGGIARAQNWVRAQDPKPYIWGGVGPYGYDCSGLVGNVYAMLQGLGMYQRYFTTASNLSSIGFRRGLGAFTIGVNPGVHTAGNIGGLPFEAGSTRTGIRVGSGASSVKSFAQQWYLAALGGAFGSAMEGLTRKQLLDGTRFNYSMLRSVIPAGRFAGGTPWVPETGMYELHRGERVVPSWQNRGGDGGATVTIERGAVAITVHPAPGMDEEALAALVDQKQREAMADLLRELRTGVRR